MSVKISKDELKSLLNTEIVKNGGYGSLYISDREYVLMSRAHVKIMKIVLFVLTMLPYREERRDCDDFAKMAVGLMRLFCPLWAFGEVWADGLSAGGYHAQNFYVTEEKTIVFYEPQNGKISDNSIMTGNRIKLDI